MIVMLNGEFVPEERARVSIFDRGLLYGDGLFETVRIHKGRPFRWELHDQRLRGGADFLGIQLSEPSERLKIFALDLAECNQMPEALLRVLLTRGVGPRGYSPQGADSPTVVMSLHPAGPRPVEMASWDLVVAPSRLPANEPLANFKTCNKLAQIVARRAADAAGANEALLLNTEGMVVEGSSSNLFWVKEGVIYTPPLAAGVLPGVTRAVMEELAGGAGLAMRQGAATPDQLKSSDGVFLSLTSIGVAEARTLDGVKLARSECVQQLHSAYWDLLEEECSTRNEAG